MEVDATDAESEPLPTETSLFGLGGELDVSPATLWLGDDDIAVPSLVLRTYDARLSERDLPEGPVVVGSIT